MTDTLQLYARETGQTELLSAEEEIELARRIAEGDIEARNHLVRANLRLVMNIAKRFQNRGCDYGDLIGDGNMGLMSAAERFNPEFKVRFATYAAYWITLRIRDALRQVAYPVRVPSYVFDLVAKFRQAQTALRQQTGEEPTEDEVIAAIPLSGKKAETLRHMLHTGRTPLDESDEPFEEETPWLEEEDERRRVYDLLDTLGERERTVLLRRAAGATYEEIGRDLGLTKQRAQQIREAAVRRLRASEVV